MLHGCKGLECYWENVPLYNQRVIRLMAALHLMPMASFQILPKQWNTKTMVIPVLHRYHVVYGSSSEKTKMSTFYLFLNSSKGHAQFRGISQYYLVPRTSFEDTFHWNVGL